MRGARTLSRWGSNLHTLYVSVLLCAAGCCIGCTVPTLFEVEDDEGDISAFDPCQIAQAKVYRSNTADTWYISLRFDERSPPTISISPNYWKISMTFYSESKAKATYARIRGACA